MNMLTRPSLVGCCAALLAGASWLAANAAWGRHHAYSEAASPGDFSYYVLSLSWSPTFCVDSPRAAECSGARRYGFIVHGLWPQNELGAPEHCGGSREVPNRVVEDIADLMPARGLVYHEWQAHGSCSGLAPQEFFEQVRRAYSQVTMPADMAHAASPIVRPTAALKADFLRSNPQLSPRSVVLTCSRQGEPRLRELRICLDRSLRPRDCSQEVLRAQCRTTNVIVTPMR
jgi:ribonuclease T2